MGDAGHVASVERGLGAGITYHGDVDGSDVFVLLHAKYNYVQAFIQFSHLLPPIGSLQLVLVRRPRALQLSVPDVGSSMRERRVRPAPVPPVATLPRSTGGRW